MTDSTPETTGKVEVDNHADTSCLGANFRVMEFTEHVVNVQPFSNELQGLENIPIATGATAWDDPDSGRITILIVHQGLWFGRRLDNSLLSPNQCRNFGISLCDDPWDPNRPLGIELREETIPFEFEQNVVYLETRAPTDEELNNPHLRRIELTSDRVWDPSKIGDSSLPLDKRQHNRLVSGVQREMDNQSKTHSPTLGYDEPCEYDALLSSCSPVFTERGLAEGLIATVQVNSADHTSRGVSGLDIKQRHSRVTAEEVAKRFHCSIDNPQSHNPAWPLLLLLPCCAFA